MEPAWHSYTTCDGFCFADNESCESSEKGHSPGYILLNSVDARQIPEMVVNKSPVRHQSCSKPPCGAAAGAVGGVSWCSRRYSGEFEFTDDAQMKAIYEYSAKSRCNFLASVQKQLFQELVKQLLSKEPSSRPTALECVSSTLHRID